MSSSLMGSPKLKRPSGSHIQEKMTSDISADTKTTNKEQSVATTKRQSTPFHALIIGIDKYPAIKQLGGAVADAKAMAAYLRDNLGVSDDQVTLLCDGKATRKAIVDALRAIKTAPINKGDPILIYFAGHGGEADAPSGWESTRSKIQLIKPYDYTPGVDVPAMNVLLDRSIAVLLADIRKEKGNNITVCFDCCHSSSGTRDDDDVVRGTEESINLSEDVDIDIWGAYPADRSATISEDALRSHVLLAACGAAERAFEEYGRGLFTKALLEELRQVGADQLTYTELIRRISTLNGGKQNPHCEGHYRWRVLFNKKPLGHRNLTHLVQKTNEGYIMDAGMIHGITEGATFVIYDNAIRTNPPLGKLITSRPLDFSTPMEIPSSCSSFQIDEEAFALLQIPGQDERLLIYIEGEDFRNHVTPLIEEMNTGVIVLQTKSTANLGLSFDGRNTFFDILDERMTKHGMSRIPFSISFDFNNEYSIENLKQVLLSASRYHWHLRRDNVVPALGDSVSVEFRLLEEEDEMEEEVSLLGRQPRGSNLIQNGIVDLIVDEDADYGIKITNTSDHPMYPFVFFFSSDFSIVSYYEPGCSGGRLDVPLLPGECVTLGYGSAGANSVRFEFDSPKQDEGAGFQIAEHNLDVTFLKIFLSTVAVDLSSIPQPSPFGNTDRGSTRELRQKGSTSQTSLWCTIDIPIVQKRSRSNTSK